MSQQKANEKSTILFAKIRLGLRKILSRRDRNISLPLDRGAIKKICVNDYETSIARTRNFLRLKNIKQCNLEFYLI
jgi:hypothetical protein